MSKRRTRRHQLVAAAAAGLSVSSGRQIKRGDLQPKAASPRGWRRPDPPLAGVGVVAAALAGTPSSPDTHHAAGASPGAETCT